MDIRPFEPADVPALERLVALCWPDDSTMRQLHGIHGRADRTLVAAKSDELVGAATVRRGRHHPTHTELVVNVAPHERNRGVGTALVTPLVKQADRAFVARTRPEEESALAFLRARGFRPLMRNRVALVDPAHGLVTDETEFQLRSAAGIPVEDAARAMEAQYRAEHASWAPAGEWSLEESVAIFCGRFWVRESTIAAYRNGKLVGIAALLGEPIAERPDELHLVHVGPLDLADPDADPITRALVAREFAFARERGLRVRIEVDEANVPLWRLIDELDVLQRSELLLLASDDS